MEILIFDYIYLLVEQKIVEDPSLAITKQQCCCVRVTVMEIMIFTLNIMLTIYINKFLPCKNCHYICHYVEPKIAVVELSLSGSSKKYNEICFYLVQIL